MKEILLIGGGGHCKAVIDVIEFEGSYKIAGIVEKDDSSKNNLLGYEIIGSDSDLGDLGKHYKYALITVGQVKTSSIRKKLFNLAIESGFILPSIISPNAYMSRHSELGRGVVVMHNSVINSNARIGDNCIINSKALIEHDCQIYDHNHISTNVTINGSVIVESDCFIGSGAIVKESTTIKQGSFIKAGTIVR
jgi:sugar O-acyltransferase (sialic acid O-acetyltransferase NeuD family)